MIRMEPLHPYPRFQCAPAHHLGARQLRGLGMVGTTTAQYAMVRRSRVSMGGGNGCKGRNMSRRTRYRTTLNRLLVASASLDPLSAQTQMRHAPRHSYRPKPLRSRRRRQRYRLRACFLVKYYQAIQRLWGSALRVYDRAVHRSPEHETGDTNEVCQIQT